MSKYFRYICQGRNEQLSISCLYFVEKEFIALHYCTTALKGEKGRVDLCQMLQIFHPSNWCTDIWKTLFVILELQFDHESGLIRTRYFELFFSVWSIFSSYKKSAPNEAGFMFFWTFAVILAKYTISTSSKKKLLQNMGHNLLKTCSKYHLVGLLNEKQVSTFGHFLNISKPYWPP